MTPGVLLAGFCATMAAIAVGRLAAAQRRDRVQIGAAAVVVGLTALSGAWAVAEVTSLHVAGSITLAVCGLAVAAAGVAVMIRHWDEYGTTRPVRD